MKTLHQGSLLSMLVVCLMRCGTYFSSCHLYVHSMHCFDCCMLMLFGVTGIKLIFDEYVVCYRTTLIIK